MDSFAVQLRHAKEDFEKGRIDLAAERYEKILKKDPKNIEALAGMGDVLLATDLYKEAENCALTIEKNAPDNPKGHLLWALAKEAQGERQQAKEKLQQTVQRHPNFFPAFLHLSHFHFEDGELEQALSFIQKALKIQPDDTKAQILLANIHLEMGNPIETIDLLKDLLKEHPRSVEAYYLLAGALMAVDNPQMTEKILAEGIKNVGPHPLLWTKYGELHVATGNYEKSIHFFKKALEARPNDAQRWFELGMVLLMKRDLEEAEKAFLEATKVDPQHWQAYFQLGDIYSAADLGEKALDVYRKAFELAPHEPAVVNNLALTLMEADESQYLEEAKDLLQKASQTIGKDDLSIHFNLALIHFKQQRFKECLALCEKMKKMPDYPSRQEEILALSRECS